MRSVHVVLLAVSAAARAALAQGADAPPRLRHVPPSEADSGEPLRIQVLADQAWKLQALDLHWRRPGGSWTVVPFGKAADGTWAAVVEASEVVPPRLEYYITSQEPGGSTVERFASAGAPHPVLVIPSDEDLLRQDRLVRFRGHRSRARLSGEWASFGPHGHLDGGPSYGDRYYRLEADYLYRILGFVSYVRFGVVRLRGTVPPPEAFTAGVSTSPGRDTGMDYGYAEISLALAEVLGLQGQLLLGADDLGFASGAGASVRIGEAARSHLEVGGQVIQRIGFDAFVRFAWDTVPRWPMSLSLHVTDQPAATLKPGVPPTVPDSQRTDRGAPAGVRAVWEVGYQVTRQITAVVRAGYQARASTAGGPTLGAGFAVEW